MSLKHSVRALYFTAIGWPANLIETAAILEAVRIVGTQLARLIRHLHRNLGARMRKLHVIGHSSGAVVAAIAGRLTGGRLGRITGLDPIRTSLLFPDSSAAVAVEQLDPSDARFVDVIHTSIGKFGIVEPCGHVDFYPNGGVAPQPGTAPDWGRWRSHSRAYAYFTESIGSQVGFWARRCEEFWSDYGTDGNNNCTRFGRPERMGDPVSRRARGAMCLRTSASRPFALGFVGL